MLVDVRETKEFEGGTPAEGASTSRCRSSRAAARELAKLKDRPVVAYCMAGNRSSAGRARRWRRAGFKDIYSCAAATGAWKDAGLPVEK